LPFLTDFGYAKDKKISNFVSESHPPPCIFAEEEYVLTSLGLVPKLYVFSGRRPNGNFNFSSRKRSAG
jgi:hypothetical protein